MTSPPNEYASSPNAGPSTMAPSHAGTPGVRANNSAAGWAAPITLRTVLNGSGIFRDGRNRAAVRNT